MASRKAPVPPGVAVATAQSRSEGSPPSRSSIDRAEEVRRPGDRGIGRPLHRGHVVHGLRGRLEDRELPVVVEERPDRRVHDGLAARLALRRLLVEGEDGIVGGAALVGGDEVHHGFGGTGYTPARPLQRRLASGASRGGAGRRADRRAFDAIELELGVLWADVVL